MTGESEQDPWLTYQQAAEMVGVKHQTVRSAARRGDLEVCRVSHRLVRIRRSWVEQWMARGSRMARRTA